MATSVAALGLPVCPSLGQGAHCADNQLHPRRKLVEGPRTASKFGQRLPRRPRQLLHPRSVATWHNQIGATRRVVPCRAAVSIEQVSPWSGSTDSGNTSADGEAAWKLPAVKDAKRVVLVRHGESTWNATGRIQGSSNFSVLTEKGEGQAETSRQMLASDQFDICFHSPLQRSAKTAEIIWGTRDAPMEAIDDLREIDLYSFQGLFKDEGKQRYGAQFRMWQVDAANFEIDDHYPVRELWGRARHCWELMLASPAKSILVVAHNAVNQALVATAIGLGPEYFRMLLQSNCGVSVLDFWPSLDGAGDSDGAAQPAESTTVSLNRLNQTPAPPVGAAQPGAGRKAKSRVILVCHGTTDSISRKEFPASAGERLNMLGLVQSRKTSELLLDVRVDTVFSSPSPAALGTANAIYEVQAAADCLGADCIPRYLDIIEVEALRDFDYGGLRGQVRPRGGEQRELLRSFAWESLDSLDARAGDAWAQIRDSLAETEAALAEASEGTPKETPRDPLDPFDALPSGIVVVVTHRAVVKGMINHCLGRPPPECLNYKIDEGSINVVDFPDGSQGRGVVRCLNYTAHLGRWAVPVTSPTFDDEAY